MVRKSRVATNVEVRALRVDFVEVCWRLKIRWGCVWRTFARAGMREVMLWIGGGEWRVFGGHGSARGAPCSGVGEVNIAQGVAGDDSRCGW